jgi:hypothetical protein
MGPNSLSTTQKWPFYKEPLELMNHKKSSKEEKKNDTFVITYEFQRKMPRIF